MSELDDSQIVDQVQQQYEQQYGKLGVQAQRLYPNEEFARFMGRNYYHLTAAERRQVSILEIGSGAGSNLWMVAKEGFDAHGIDFSPTAVDLCQETKAKWAVDFDCRVGNMLDLEYPNERFDAVADVFSATHLPFEQHKQMYAEANRVLKSGGKFFSYHPSDQSYSFQHSGSELYDQYTVTSIVNEKAPYVGNGLMCFLPADECRRLLIEVGFTEINIERTSRTYGNGETYFEFLSVDATKP